MATSVETLLCGLADVLERTYALRALCRATREKAQQLQYTALVLRHASSDAREAADTARAEARQRHAAFACGRRG